MNWHEVIDERNYEMHQVIAGILRQDPAKLDLAVAWMEKFLADPNYSIHSKDALSEWRALIRRRGLEGVLEVLDDRGENATRMRQSSPFAVLMPQDKRLEILRRYEARDLEHILRASKGVTGESEFIVIGSQAILGSHPDAPKELRESIEADLIASVTKNSLRQSLSDALAVCRRH